jgi:hypothetical protein
MPRLLVPFLALALAAIVPALSPAQAVPRDHQAQVARATSTEPTARRHPRHHVTAHTTRHHRTHTAHHPTHPHHVAHNRNHRHPSHPTSPT